MSDNQPKSSSWLRRCIRWLMFLSLITLAATAWFWPKQPLWWIEHEQLLGLDETQKRVVTTLVNSEGLLLREYSIESGVMQRSRVLINSQSSEPESELISNHWMPLLSLDGRAIVCNVLGRLRIFDAETAQQVSQLEQDIDFSMLNGLDALCIANHGHFVAAYLAYTVYVWDAKTGKRLHEIELPEGTYRTFGTGPLGMTAQIEFSLDDQYLAIVTDRRVLLVFELKTMREVGRITELASPGFSWLPDRAILLNHNVYDPSKHRLFQLENQKLVEVKSFNMADFDGILSVNFDGILRGHWSPRMKLPDWLPGVWQTWWKEWQSRRPGTIRMTWTKTGTDRQKAETMISLPHDQFEIRALGAITDNGQTVIIRPKDSIVAWSLTGWSWYRWLLFLLPLLLIVVIFRPRKVILSGSGSLQTP